MKTASSVISEQTESALRELIRRSNFRTISAGFAVTMQALQATWSRKSVVVSTSFISNLSPNSRLQNVYLCIRGSRNPQPNFCFSRANSMNHKGHEVTQRKFER